LKEWDDRLVDKGKLRDWDYGVLDKDDIVSSLYRCRLFLDDIGNVGIAPDAACEGDVICFIRGTRSPCLLRPRDRDGWTLVSGDCFIQISAEPYTEWDEKNICLFLEKNGDMEETFLIF
jgi:hypothetical protein